MLLISCIYKHVHATMKHGILGVDHVFQSRSREMCTRRDCCWRTWLALTRLEWLESSNAPGLCQLYHRESSTLVVHTPPLSTLSIPLSSVYQTCDCRLCKLHCLSKCFKTVLQSESKCTHAGSTPIHKSLQASEQLTIRTPQWVSACSGRDSFRIRTQNSGAFMAGR